MTGSRSAYASRMLSHIGRSRGGAGTSSSGTTPPGHVVQHRLPRPVVPLELDAQRPSAPPPGSAADRSSRTGRCPAWSRPNPSRYRRTRCVPTRRRRPGVTAPRAATYVGRGANDPRPSVGAWTKGRTAGAPPDPWLGARRNRASSQPSRRRRSDGLGGVTRGDPARAPRRLDRDVSALVNRRSYRPRRAQVGLHRFVERRVVGRRDGVAGVIRSNCALTISWRSNARSSEVPSKLRARRLQSAMYGDAAPALWRATPRPSSLEPASSGYRDAGAVAARASIG
jgi:hypothetical protein